MAQQLFDGALDNVKGCVYFSEIVEPDESKLEKFYKKFPHKERAITKSQVEFEKAVIEIDNGNS